MAGPGPVRDRRRRRDHRRAQPPRRLPRDHRRGGGAARSRHRRARGSRIAPAAHEPGDPQPVEPGAAGPKVRPLPGPSSFRLHRRRRRPGAAGHPDGAQAPAPAQRHRGHHCPRHQLPEPRPAAGGTRRQRGGGSLRRRRPEHPRAPGRHDLRDAEGAARRAQAEPAGAGDGAGPIPGRARGELAQEGEANRANLDRLHADLRTASDERIRAIERRNDLLKELAQGEDTGAATGPWCPVLRAARLARKKTSSRTSAGGTAQNTPTSSA